MFSQLGPLFKTTLRQAEKSDARLDIRRHDPEDQNKKQKHDEEPEGPSLLWDDSTEVSVGALRTFLLDFLHGKIGDDKGSAANNRTTSETAPMPPAEAAPPTNPNAARAAMAYGATAAHTPPQEQPMAPEDSDESGEIDLTDLLEADELRTIHVLIHELEMLSRTGVQTLVIEKADSFLQAVVRAVKTHKENI